MFALGMPQSIQKIPNKEATCGNYVTVGMTSLFPVSGSFAVRSLTERLADPQAMKPNMDFIRNVMPTMQLFLCFFFLLEDGTEYRTYLRQIFVTSFAACK
jgi:hypothetical protein